MAGADFPGSYLDIADQLFRGEITEIEVEPLFVNIPPLDQNLLQQLAKHAETFSTTRPKYGWAIAQVGYVAATLQTADVFTRSLAAWYLARASNHWTQPKRAREAAEIARHGFEQTGDAGWIAACDWQTNALAWTQPNFAETAQALKDALTTLEAQGVQEFIPDCRLSLAYAQILIGQHTAALENIQRSEEAFIHNKDAVNQARCWLHQASSLRRQDRFEAAFEKLKAALDVFAREGSITDQGKAHYQIAIGNMLQADHLSEAIEHFQKAVQLFEETDLELWRGMSVNSLGAVYMINGQLHDAASYYQDARGAFERHDILGLLADNLNDSGKLNVLMGRPAESVEQLRQSIQINDRLGAQLSGAVAMSNLGEAYGHLGRYQDALSYLEQAVERLDLHNAFFRMATCEKYMATIWLRLGQPAQAHEFLDRSAAHYEMAGQHALLSSVHNYRAATFIQEGKTADAVQALENSLQVSRTYGLRPQSALALRLLGEALIKSSRRADSLTLLDEAMQDFAEMGMTLEQAACLVSKGSWYASDSKSDKAAELLEEAIHISDGAFPEIDWRAHVELGDLAEAQGKNTSALAHYHQGIGALSQIRANFLQPGLAGSYFFSPARVFDHIISFAATHNADLDALHFIEESKASTLLRSLRSRVEPVDHAESNELHHLRDEIEQLKSQLKVSPSEVHPLQSALQMRKVREQLKQKAKQYDELKSRLERKSLRPEFIGSTPAFRLDQFRRTASTFLADHWAALDYFMTSDELIVVLITSREIHISIQPVSARFEMSLMACDRARRNAEPLSYRDMEVLGQTLIPVSLANSLSPDTHLLISPHQRLHQVPWAALQPGFWGRPLVEHCIPSIVPSLQSLTLLWERSNSVSEEDRHTGILVGISSFHGAHPEIPFVKAEVNALSSILGSQGRRFTENDASWQNLLQLRNAIGFNRFAWLHMASHFFSDRHTGRLSGLALSDGDIFLDQLRDLSPLPGLVSLSACNSNDSFLFEGDERVDLQTTCFLAGANTVIGSSWPVLDDAAAELTVQFFEHYLGGASPSQAVAYAQRQSIKTDKSLQAWASFVCAGKP